MRSKTLAAVVCLLAATVVFSTACSTGTKSRLPASADPNLDGVNRLGHGAYQFFRKGPNQPAIRIYLSADPEQPGAYYGVLFEYARILSIAPKYFTARKAPAINEVIGYLKKIGATIRVFHLVPAPAVGPLTYSFQSLRVEGERIVAVPMETPHILVLSSGAPASDPLSGAEIKNAVSRKRAAFFPPEGIRYDGIEYETAALAYKKAKLDSTWRKEFLRGSFLAAYGKLNDEVVRFSRTAEGDRAHFIDNSAKFGVNLSDPASRRKRANVFTHPSSAFLSGDYDVKEPVDGMFVLKARVPGQKGAEIVEGRIGLYIDIFDATKSLNQDVVEVAFVNPKDPSDFLMYYEHPDNGEGDQPLPSGSDE